MISGYITSMTGSASVCIYAYILDSFSIVILDKMSFKLRF